LLQPYEWWSRFTMILPAIGAVALVHVVERLRGRPRVALQFASAALVFFGAALATGRIDPAGHGREISAFHVVRLAFEPGRDRTLGKVFHPEYAWLDSIPQDSRIDVELGYEPRFVYPAFGPRFSRPVHRLYAEDNRAFEDQLVDDRAAYVFVGHGKQFDRMASHDPSLTPVYRDDRVSAYRVNQAATAASAAPSGQGRG